MQSALSITYYTAGHKPAASSGQMALEIPDTERRRAAHPIEANLHPQI